jgi:energy-coupling factor transporter ATP-binding protein EcfA2
VNISIQNFRGVRQAEFALSEITVVAGDNGAGKSSIAQALAAALTGQCPIRGLKKSDYHQFIHAGQAIARAEIKTEDGLAAISYPKGEGYREGVGPSSSPYAAGLISPVDIDPRQAVEAWQVILQSMPTEKDLRAALAGLTDDVEIIVGLVNARGYDGAYLYLREEGTKLKGRWEQITGDRYGTKKAETWRPEGFDLEHAQALIGQSADVLAAKLEQAEADYKKAIATAAVSQDEREKLTRAAQGLVELEADFAQAQARLDEAREAAVKAEEAYAARPPALPRLVDCPYCGKPLEIRNGELCKGQGKLSEAELKKREKQEAELFRQVNEARENEINKRLTVNLNKQTLDAARAAAEKLAALPPAEDALDPAPFEAAVREARQHLAWNEVTYAAAEAHQKIIALIGVVDLLAPEGLRKRKLEAALVYFNSALSVACDAAKWGRVKVEADLSVSYNGRPYAVLSESEQYRVRATLQTEIARLDKSDVLIFDRADLLTAPGRRGLWHLCRASGKRAVIFLSANTTADFPGAIWLEGGSIAGA